MKKPMKEPKKEVRSKLLEGIKLQLFAEGGEEGDPTPPNTDGSEPPQDTPPENTEEKTFNQDDVDKIITKRLERERKSFKEELEREKEEAEKLAKLSEAERQKAILDSKMSKFEEERAKFQREKIELEVTKQMASKNLPVEFANLLVGETAEASFENIVNFEGQWKESLEKAVNERLKGNTPNAGGQAAESKENGLGARLAKQRSQANLAVESPYFK